MCGVRDRLSLFEQFFAGEEGYSEPIDEFGKVFLRVDQRIIALFEVGENLLAALDPRRIAVRTENLNPNVVMVKSAKHGV